MCSFIRRITMGEEYNRRKILIIEDEAPIADLIRYSLKKEGYIVNVESNGSGGINAVKTFNPDLIILDLMLPDISGFDVCRMITNEHSIPIIILTAKNDINDKILGIELGADDYITKPFDMRESIARIKAVFRRIDLTNARSHSCKIIKIGKNIEINMDERSVTKDGEIIEFTHKEFDLLAFLADNRGRVFTREQLLDKVWGFEYAGDTRTVDIHIQRIRRKLDLNKSNSIIETVFSVGYKLI
jgi:DNA-binding response OmpR family regulator